MKIHLLLALSFSFVIKSFCQYHYPPTKTADSSSTYWGVTYKDPYRWLENIKSPEAESWYKQQANFTDSILNHISGRNELIAEYKKLNNLQPPRIRNIIYEGGNVFYKKMIPGEKVAKLYYRKGINETEILLFDPTTYIKDKLLSIQGILPSYDGKKIIIWYSENGAEISTIKVMDVDLKVFLPESIYPSWFGAISWTFDNKSFTYFSQKTGDNTSPEFELDTKTRLHVLGDDVKNDKDFFSNESYSNLDIKRNDLPFVELNKDSKSYIFANLSNVRSEMYTYYAPIQQFNNKKIEWKILCKPEDGIVRSRVVIENDVYAICNKNAKNYKLIHTTLIAPNWENAEVIAPEKKDLTLENIFNCKDFLLLNYSNGINDRLYKYHLKTKIITEIQLPFNGITDGFCLDTKTNNCYISIASWTKPRTEFQYNAQTDAFTLSNFNKAPNYPKVYTDLMVEEVEVKGHDGALIPLSIIYKKGLKKDGSTACLMEGYGAYGTSFSPYFNTLKLALAIKNVVIAIPHVRGGSEKGEAWYKAGYKTTKPNTWKDFNSCAEYLIANGYTSANKLAGAGTSAGGIMISRAITERPDLYAAAICNVGWANALRTEFSPNGPGNIPEFGTVKDSLECKALYEMDGVQHVKIGIKYPAVICIGGWNDPRVIVWEPGKFAAALQQASTSGKPVLMKVNYDNGHFTENKDVTFANFANQYAFVMWQCGHPDFQLK